MYIRQLILGSLGLLFGAVLTTTSSTAQPRPEREPAQVIRVTGDGEVTTTPDQVLMEIGVMTRGATAQNAAVENARKVEKVLAALRKELGAAATITTVNYNLNPDYQQPRDGGDQPVISGYTAFNSVRVMMTDLLRVGKVIDVAIEAGANSVQRVEFSLKNAKQSKAESLKLATLDARSKADAIADALGMKVVRVVSVEEGGAIVPYRGGVANRMMESSTPINSGTVGVYATVTLTVEVSQ